MRHGRVTLLATLIIGAAFPIAAANGNRPKASMRPVATAAHTCGERRYVVGKSASLKGADEIAVRDIISFLYDGAKILLEYPGAPAPVANEQTRREMMASGFVRGMAGLNPTAAQIAAEADKIFSHDPVSWNIHRGPTASRIKQILEKDSFRKRLGERGAKLIEKRLNGEMGQRGAIVGELSKQFGVREVADYWSDENCHIANDFGQD